MGAVVYLATTSLPYLAVSPSTDPLFGTLNECLTESINEPRIGFAVSAEGRRAAGFGGTTLAVCTAPPPENPAAPASRRTFALSGITHAAFDFEGHLWLATEARGTSPAELWRLGPDAAAPVRSGPLAPVSLAGHAHGLASLDNTGRLMSLDAAGHVLGYAQLPGGRPGDGAQLATSSDGEQLALVVRDTLFVYRASDLTLVAAESPCAVEFAWWRPTSEALLVSCGPRSAWALELFLPTRQREAAPSAGQARSALVPRLGAYVRSCDALPCTAPAP